MADIFHDWGNDLALSPSGDLRPVDQTKRGEQRIIRRLMTNLSTYIWHPDYGASVPKRIGGPLDLGLIEGIVRGQIYLEPAVSRDPIPRIIAQKIPDGVFIRILYTDAETGQQLDLAFDVSP